MCNKCNTVQTVNLQTAVLMQVQEFATSGQAFSKWDISKALRQKCNDGLLEIPECENTDPSASYRFNIVKSDVDVIFEQLFSNCLANGLPPLRFDFQRAPNGVGYRVFTVDQQALAALGNSTPATPAAAPSPSYVSAPTAVAPAPYVPTPVPTAPATPATPLPDSELKRRVALYMDRCNKIGVVPTLKNIQSAIKRGNKSTGLSYGEIANLAKSLGYTV